MYNRRRIYAFKDELPCLVIRVSGSKKSLPSVLMSMTNERRNPQGSFSLGDYLTLAGVVLASAVEGALVDVTKWRVFMYRVWRQAKRVVQDATMGTPDRGTLDVLRGHQSGSQAGRSYSQCTQSCAAQTIPRAAITSSTWGKFVCNTNAW